MQGALGYGKGRTRLEVGTRVPCLVHGPGRIVSGVSTRELLSLVDIYRTVADLLGVNVPRKLPRPNSYSFVDFLTGAAKRGPREWMFAYRGTDRQIRSRDYICTSLGMMDCVYARGLKSLATLC